jgi:hypothetical protein
VEREARRSDLVHETIDFKVDINFNFCEQFLINKRTKFINTQILHDLKDNGRGERERR